MKHLINSILILIASITIGCSVDSPITDDNKTNGINTPPIFTKIEIPAETSIFREMPNTIEVFDKDNDGIRIHIKITEHSLTESKTTTKEDYIQRNHPLLDQNNHPYKIYWKPLTRAHSADITITIRDIPIIQLLESYDNTATNDFYFQIENHPGINPPTTIQKHIVVKEANQIIAGQKMGQIHIGQHKHEIESILGKPVPTHTGFTVYKSNKYGRTLRTYVIFNEQQRVITAGITSQQGKGAYLRTPAGNGLGSIPNNSPNLGVGIYHEFGRTNDIRWDFGGKLHVYKELGIAWQYGIKSPSGGNAGIVNGVIVFNAEGYEHLSVIDETDTSKAIIIR